MPCFHGEGITAVQVKEGKRLFDKHKDTLIPVYLPTASTEFMVME